MQKSIQKYLTEAAEERIIEITYNWKVIQYQLLQQSKKAEEYV